jgi:Ca2+-binding RTX toxin-like protein
VTTYTLPGAHRDYNRTVYGNSTILAGGGNDTLNIITKNGHGKGYISVTGGNDSLTIIGKGTVSAGNGDDTVTVTSKGAITVGNGDDQISLYGDGTVSQKGAAGHDTINFGTGNDTLFERGTATVHGAFGSATMSNGELDVHKVGGIWDVTETGNGPATLMGGNHRTDLSGGKGVTFVDGTGNDTMTGTGQNWFEFNSGAAGSHDSITNFVSSDHLYLEGYSLQDLQNISGAIVGHAASGSASAYTLITLPDGTKVTVDGVDGTSHPHQLNISPTKP